MRYRFLRRGIHILGITASTTPAASPKRGPAWLPCSFSSTSASAAPWPIACFIIDQHPALSLQAKLGSELLAKRALSPSRCRYTLVMNTVDPLLALKLSIQDRPAWRGHGPTGSRHVRTERPTHSNSGLLLRKGYGGRHRTYSVRWCGSHCRFSRRLHD